MRVGFPAPAALTAPGRGPAAPGPSPDLVTGPAGHDEDGAAQVVAPPTALQTALDPDPRDLDNDGRDDATGVPVVRASTAELLDLLASTRQDPGARDGANASPPEVPADDDLSIDEQRMLRELQARDVEVRAHEQAHQAAAAGLTGAARYHYQEGPDGRRYAVGGEVTIRHGGGGTPEERIDRARRVQAAATAPGAPSGADLGVAAQAVAEESHARTDLARHRADTAYREATALA